METSFHKKFGTELPKLEYCRKRKPATTPGRNEFQRFASKTARENMRRQWAGYGEPKWQRMRRPSAATAITNQTDATRSQQHQHNCFLDIEPSQMVFQGDARNELGPSPRGAIYRKRQAWKHLFTRSSVPSYQDWNIAENENLQQLPSPRLLALASRQKTSTKIKQRAH